MSDVVDMKVQSIGGYLLSAAWTMTFRMCKIVVGIGAVAAALLYWKQDSMLYFPGGLCVIRSFCLSLS